MSTVISLDKKGRTTLPEEVRAELGLKAGDLLILERTDRGTFELVPASLVPNDQLWFYHPEMQTRIRKAERDLREGRFKTFATLGEVKSYLDSLKTRRARRTPKRASRSRVSGRRHSQA
jgi:AbrB family looped-hinge helix DNA binding protein